MNDTIGWDKNARRLEFSDVDLDAINDYQLYNTVAVTDDHDDSESFVFP